MIGPRGRDLIRRFEGLRLEAYDDGVGVWTLGYGHTKGVKLGDVVTRAEAEILLEADLADAEAAVERCIKAPLNEAMRDALAVFAFNCGGKALAGSELCGHVNGGHHFAAARSFLNWINAGGHPLRGLMRRRLAEAELYCDDPWPPKPVTTAT